jgi:hypothetical protein
MTKKIEQVVLAGIRRSVNTASGNPRYVLTLEDGREFRTADDAAVNHSITNEDYQGVLVDLTVREARVVGIEVSS